MGQTQVPKVVHDNFSPIELEQLQEHFKVLAKKLDPKSQHIAEQTFSKYFLKEDLELSKRLYKAFDFDNDGKLNLYDFLLSMAICIKTSDDSRRTFAFRMFDTSGKASVSEVNHHFPDPPVPITVEAMWDFDKLHDKELGIKRGETAVLISKYDTTWWVVQNKDGEVGYVAASYLRETETSKVGLLAIPQDSAGRITLEQFLKWAATSESVRNFCLTLKNFSVQPPPAVDLGGPTNFRHTTHIGLDTLPDWQALLTQADIQPEEIADPQTALFLLTVIKEERDRQLAGPPASKLPPIPDDLPPPPPPDNFPPAPTDEVPPPPIDTAPTPPGEKRSIPLPPPRPQKRKAMEVMPEPSMVHFLEEIKNPSKKLKTVTPADINLDNLTTKETNDLVGILKKAMLMRRNDVGGGNPAPQTNDEEWE